MRLSIAQTLTIFGAIGSIAMAAPAYAGCGDNALVKPAVWQGQAGDLFQPANFDKVSIVGMWSVQFFVGSSMIDFGYQQWHRDGTEFLNSGDRSPATQNFCLGVWEQTGPFRYKLNHFALSYDMNGTYNAKVNIREDVTLDPRSDTYSGSFTIDVYPPSGGAAVQHVAGRVTGKRVTVNTTP